MTESPHIIALDESNFVEVVVEGSATQPVLVDFWADWCGPCKSLMPVLEKLAVEYGGAFVLAKLDTEAHPGIAQQLGIRSLPTVKLFKDRQLVDEFMGALPESEVRTFLDKHVEAQNETAEEPVDTRVEVAMQLFDQGQTTESQALLKQAQAEDPTNVQVLLALGQVSIAGGDLETAKSCISVLPEEVKEGSDGKRLVAMLTLAEEASGDSGDTAELEAQLAADEKNTTARYELALQIALQGDAQGAMDHLLKIVSQQPDFNEGAAQKKLIALFDVLGDDPLAGVYRRKMFALLH